MNLLLGNLLLLAVSTSAKSASLSLPAIELLQSMGLPSFSMNNIRKGEKIREDDSDIYYINIPPTTNFNAHNDLFQQNDYNSQDKYGIQNDYSQNDYAQNDYVQNDYISQSNDYHDNSIYGLQDYQDEAPFPGIVGFEEVGGGLDTHWGVETDKTTTTEYPFHKIPIDFKNNGRPHQIYHWSRPVETNSHKQFVNSIKTTTTTPKPTTTTTIPTTYIPVTVPSISTSWPPHPSKVTTKKPWASFIKQFSANGKPTGLYIYKSKPIVRTYKKYKHPAFRHFNY